jgi:hypothetical protein
MRPKIPSRAAGLTVLVLASWMATVAVADGPVSPPPTAPTVAPSAEPSVLLLTTGQVVQGTITETDEGYEVKTKIGPLPYRRHQVERAFGSLAEVYQYQVQRLPSGDTDERLKLARWCLEQKLIPEAQEQLEAVLAVSPSHGPAKAMLFQLRAAARGGATTDQAVVRTGGEQPRVEPPGTLSLTALRDAYRASPRGAGLPVIFDLPPALAVKRYQEFAVFVHPDLQRRCAECHHETSNLPFQLIRAQSKRDLENELLVRANLDAVLHLVDPKDPSRSALISAAVLPHKPTGRPILTGRNDPTYGRIATWLNGIKSPTAAPPAAAPAVAKTDSVVPARLNGATGGAMGRPGGFAADRSGAAPTPEATPAPGAPQPRAAASPPGARQFSPLPAPAETGAPNTVRLRSGETVAVDPVPAGQLLPGSTVGRPYAPPPPSAFQPQQRPVPPAPAEPNQAAPATATADPKKKTINVPGEGEVEVVDLDEPPTPAPKDKKKPKLKTDALQKFITGGRR